MAVWENDTLLKLANNPLGVDQNAGSWFYDGTNLYLHASDGSNVATQRQALRLRDRVEPVVHRVGQRQILADFRFAGPGGNLQHRQHAADDLGGLYLTGSNSIVRNLSIARYVSATRFTIYTGATNNIVTNVTAYNSYGTSPLAIYGSGTTGNLVQNSTFYNDTFLASAYVVTGGVWGVIVAHGGSTGNTVDSCVIYSTAGPYRPILSPRTATACWWATPARRSRFRTAFFTEISSGACTWADGNDGEGTGGQVTLWDNLIDISQSYLSNSGGNAAYFFGRRGNIRLQQHDLWAADDQPGDQRAQHFDRHAGEKQYCVHGRLRHRRRVVGNRLGVRLQRLFFRVGHAVQLGRHGVHVGELADE